MKLFGIYGAGGCGRGIMPLAREQLQLGDGDELVFVDDGDVGTVINGHRVLTFEEFAGSQGELNIALAAAESRLRQRLAALGTARPWVRRVRRWPAAARAARRARQHPLRVS